MSEQPKPSTDSEKNNGQDYYYNPDALRVDSDKLGDSVYEEVDFKKRPENKYDFNRLNALGGGDSVSAFEDHHNLSEGTQEKISDDSAMHGEEPSDLVRELQGKDDREVKELENWSDLEKEEMERTEMLTNNSESQKLEFEGQGEKLNNVNQIEQKKSEIAASEQAMKLAFEKLKKQKQSLENTKKNYRRFSQVMKKLGIGADNHESVAKEEVMIVKNSYNQARDAFKASYERFIQSRLANGEKADVLVAGEPSIFDDYLAKLKEIDSIRSRRDAEKERGIVKKTFDWYRKIPAEKRILTTAAIAGGTLAALTPGVGLLAAGGYIGYRALKGIAGYHLSKMASKEIGAKMDEVFEKKESGIKELAKEKFVENGNVLKSVEEFHKKQKNLYRGKLVAKLGAGLAMSLVLSGGFSHLLDGHFSPAFASEISTGARTNIDIDEKRLFPDPRGTDSRIIKSEEFPDPRGNDSRVPIKESQIDHLEKMKDLKEQVIIKRNDSFWKLVEKKYHGLSGRQLDRAVANDILRFKKETIEKLTSDGMEADQAEKYVSWRFKNLKEGEIIRIAEDGNGGYRLKMDNFADENHLKKFKLGQKNSFNNENLRTSSSFQNDEAIRAEKTGVNFDELKKENNLNDPLLHQGGDVSSDGNSIKDSLGDNPKLNDPILTGKEEIEIGHQADLNHRADELGGTEVKKAVKESQKVEQASFDQKETSNLNNRTEIENYVKNHDKNFRGYGIKIKDGHSVFSDHGKNFRGYGIEIKDGHSVFSKSSYHNLIERGLSLERIFGTEKIKQGENFLKALLDKNFSDDSISHIRKLNEMKRWVKNNFRSFVRENYYESGALAGKEAAITLDFILSQHEKANDLLVRDEEIKYLRHYLKQYYLNRK